MIELKTLGDLLRCCELAEDEKAPMADRLEAAEAIVALETTETGKQLIEAVRKL